VRPIQALAAAVVLAGVLTLTGCAARHYPPRPAAPVVSRPYPPRVAVKTPAKPDFYVVQKGDTLHSIAFRFGIAEQTLASWNDLSPPYKVNTGKVLRLIQPKQAIRPDLGSRPAVGVVEKRRDSPQKKSTISIDNNDILKLYWQWPLKGSILKTYSAEDSKGIDIAGEIGQTVRAAAAGKVVYSGDGLFGYGNLLIIKHDDLYLSAYANNSKLLVSEGAEVDKGQPIAEVGSVGSRACLHFEIRKNGSPVNPVEYLPEK